MKNEELNEQYNSLSQIIGNLLSHERRVTKLMFSALIASLVINVVIVGAFIAYEMSWDYSSTITTETTEQSADGEGGVINNVDGNQFNDEAINKKGCE